jgi:hypothetical protein
MSMENVPIISLNCPTCGEIMSLTGYSPTCQSVIYDYLCRGDGDRLSWRPRRTAANSRHNRPWALPSTLEQPADSLASREHL